MEEYRERINRIVEYYETNNLIYRKNTFLHQLKATDDDRIKVHELITRHELIQMGATLEEEKR